MVVQLGEDVSTNLAFEQGHAMHSLRNSISKRLYTLRLSSDKCASEWQKEYWKEKDGVRFISCNECPKFIAKDVRCSVPFGSPVRKCASAAQEANLHLLSGQDLLEIGFGRHSIPRRLVKSAGGTWTGIEPLFPAAKRATMGKAGFGHVADIPFPDCTFDIVVGIQSIEHWDEPLPIVSLKTGHAAGLEEVHRVLKPGGSIYFCAPIHLHGHEMFITGDIERIRKLFEPLQWKDIRLELWREDHLPLERYQTPDADAKTWEQSVSSYSKELLKDILENRSVSLLTIKANKNTDR
ncbi:MAG: class I SAM-dependent methyltransferase [Desulfobulbaceae bacterium]|nr:MAG: class I SAM-dependent methyltransferase [Desulfobulbaceae bacterium]